MTKQIKASAKTIKKSPETSTVQTMTLSNLTVQTIEKTKAAIDEGLSKALKVEIIAENIESIDLSYVQLMLAVNKTYTDGQVSFRFSGNIPDGIRKLLDNTGFSSIQ
jgi:predicted component of type VI protein secretion system